MNDLTRREFMQVVTGAAVAGTIAGTIAGSDARLQAEPVVASRRAAGQSHAQSQAASLPLKSLVFPEPQEISYAGSDFFLDDQVTVAVPSDPSQQDLLLATMLVNEVSDRFGQHLRIERAASLRPGRRVILMGSMENPLVRRYCTEMGLTTAVQEHGAEGYLLRTDGNMAVVAGNSDRGAFYGLQSLRQLLVNDEDRLRIRGVQISDWPDKPFRGIYLFLPGRDNIPFFKRFIATSWRSTSTTPSSWK